MTTQKVPEKQKTLKFLGPNPRITMNWDRFELIMNIPPFKQKKRKKFRINKKASISEIINKDRRMWVG